MTTTQAEEKLRARVQAALEAGPAPHRGRLAAIEQSLPTDRGRRRRIAPELAAALLAAAAATAGAAYWWDPLAEPAAEEDDPSPVSQPSEQKAEPAEPRTDDRAQEADEAPAGETEPDDGEYRDTPVIYRR